MPCTGLYWIGQCGNDPRLSRDEIVVLVYTMLESMLCAKTSTHDAGQRSYDSNFPVSLPFYSEIMVALGDTNEDRHYSSSQIS